MHRLPRRHFFADDGRHERGGLRELRGKHVLGGDGRDDERCVSGVPLGF
jgi:hypothetical protein